MALVSRLLFAALVFALAPTAIAIAGEADVVDVKVKEAAPGVYRFDVTVSHADTGWEYYANKWDVLAPDGTVLGTRELLHPHVREQPFTRSLSGVRVPAEISKVTLLAHDFVHGYGGAEMVLQLPR